MAGDVGTSEHVVVVLNLEATLLKVFGCEVIVFVVVLKSPEERVGGAIRVLEGWRWPSGCKAGAFSGSIDDGGGIEAVGRDLMYRRHLSP